MIVVEGFDGSGKSTIAAAISSMLDWPVVHAGGPPVDEDDVRTCLDLCRARMLAHCIQDRITHISESVYSMLTCPSRAAIALDAIGDVRDVTLIYCRPPVLLLRSLTSHELKSHDTPELIARISRQAPELISIYDTVVAVASRRCDTFTYDRMNLASYLPIVKHLQEKFCDRNKDR